MFIASLISAALVAGPPAPIAPIVPEGWQSTVENLHYTPAIVAGDDVFLSGVVAGVPDYDINDPRPLTEEEITASVDRAFQTIEVILTEAGSDWDHVVEITTYHTDIQEQIGAFAVAKDRYIKAPYPAWTAIDIDRLYPDGGIVEIKVRAKRKWSKDMHADPKSKR